MFVDKRDESKNMKAPQSFKRNLGRDIFHPLIAFDVICRYACGHNILINVEIIDYDEKSFLRIAIHEIKEIKAQLLEENVNCELRSAHYENTCSD